MTQADQVAGRARPKAMDEVRIAVDDELSQRIGGLAVIPELLKRDSELILLEWPREQDRPGCAGRS
jgi:hypothetical protein